MKNYKFISLILVVTILAMLFGVLPRIGAPKTAEAGPVVIDTSTDTGAFTNFSGMEDKTFIANGRIWVFWYDGTNMVWSSSSDNGTNWEAKATLRANASHMELALACDSDNNTVQYAYSEQSAAANPIYYRSGDLNTDGTITWRAAEQTAVAGVALKYYISLSIETLSTDEPVIMYIYASGTTWGVPTVSMSSTENGTWTTGGGYPKTLNAAHGSARVTRIAPFSTGTFYCLWVFSGSLRGMYNAIGGAGWDADSSTVQTSIDTNLVGFHDLVVADDDSLRILTSEDTTHHIRYSDRDYATGTWSSSIEIDLSVSSGITRPTLSVLSDNNMIVYGCKTTKHYYTMYKDGVWGTQVEWFSSAATITWQNAPEFNTTNKWYVIYSEGNASPYNIMFETIGGPTCVTDAADPVGVTRATLNGEINSITTPETTVSWRFQYGADATYGTNSSWTDNAVVGDVSLLRTGLPAGGHWHFRLQVENEFGEAYGVDREFTLAAIIDPPTMLLAIPFSSSEVVCSWINGSGAEYSILRYATAAYPPYGGGTLAYTGVAQSYEVTGLDAGVTYYFSVWCEQTGEAPSISDNAMATTYSGYAGVLSTAPTGTDDDPDTTIIDTTPFHDVGDWVADQLGMAHGFFYGFVYLIITALFGIGVAIMTRSVTTTILSVIVLCCIGIAFHLVSIIFLFMYIVAAMGWGYVKGGQAA